MFERKGSKEEQIFNMRIGMLISKRLSEFDSMRDDEVNSFRRDILAVCKVGCLVFADVGAGFPRTSYRDLFLSWWLVAAFGLWRGCWSKMAAAAAAGVAAGVAIALDNHLG